MARSTAPRLATGSVPGSARSTGEAWVFAAAPNAVDAPLKIFECVDSCACVSIPITTSKPRIMSAPRSSRQQPRRAQVPVGGTLERVRRVQQRALGEVVADQLQADRHVAGAEA